MANNASGVKPPSRWRTLVLCALVAFLSVTATVLVLKCLAPNTPLLEGAKLFVSLLVPVAIGVSAYVAIRAYNAAAARHVTLITNEVMRDWFTARMEAFRQIVWNQAFVKPPPKYSRFKSIPVTPVAEISDRKLRRAMRHICHFLNRVAFLRAKGLVPEEHLDIFFGVPILEYGSLFGPIIHAERVARRGAAPPGAGKEKYLPFFEHEFRLICKARHNVCMSFEKLHAQRQQAPGDNAPKPIANSE